MEQFTSLYSNTIKRPLLILCFLHFADNRKETDKNDKNYDSLLKMRTVFEMISSAYAK
jgi:hypothetical protein